MFAAGNEKIVKTPRTSTGSNTKASTNKFSSIIMKEINYYRIIKNCKCNNPFPKLGLKNENF